jgi:hypothetical protein
MFQQDSSGAFVSWDGSLENLVGNIIPRPLTSTEEMIAFSNFVPANLGVTAAELTIYFAYSFPDTGELVYSSTPVQVNITP